MQETWSYPPWDKRLKDFGFDQKEMYRGIKGRSNGCCVATRFEDVNNLILEACNLRLTDDRKIAKMVVASSVRAGAFVTEQ